MAAWCQVCHVIGFESRDEGKSKPSLYGNMASYIDLSLGGGGRFGCGRERERAGSWRRARSKKVIGSFNFRNQQAETNLPVNHRDIVACPFPQTLNLPACPSMSTSFRSE